MKKKFFFLVYFTKSTTNFYYQLADIENKPEAPWIKRTDDGIIFTDNI